ncbi:MAG: hypothetical protein AABX11_01190 [Nanoarchaeota archaeon]
MARGLFIAFEGMPTCGKGTQANKLFAHMRYRANCEKKHLTVLSTSEPRNSERIKELISSDSKYKLPGEKVKLYLRDRAEHYQTEISPALERGNFVLCEGYNFMTAASFISYGGSLEEFLTLPENEEFGKPDLTILFKISPDQVIENLSTPRSGANLQKSVSEQSLAYYQLLAKNLDDLARLNLPLFGKIERITVDGRMKSDIGEEVRHVYNPLFFDWLQKERTPQCVSS